MSTWVQIPLEIEFSSQLCGASLDGTIHFHLHLVMALASKAQLDARPTGDQEVVGLTPTGSATFFHGD